MSSKHVVISRFFSQFKVDDDEEDQIMFNEDPCLDLFSEKIFKSAQECLDHCKSTYGFDIQVRMKL